MAWQQLQINGPRVSLADSIMEAYATKQKREQDQYENLMGERKQNFAEGEAAQVHARQAYVDREARKKEVANAIVQAHAIAQTDPEGAQAIMQAIGAKYGGSEDAYIDTPGMPGAAAAARPQAAPVPQGPAPSAPLQQAQQKIGAMGDMMRSSMQGAGMPTPPQAAAPASQGPPVQQGPAGAPPTEQPELAKEPVPRRYVGKKMHFSVDGQDMSFDPTNSARLEQQTRLQSAQALQAALADDPELAKMVIPMAMQGVNPDKIYDQVMRFKDKKEARDISTAQARERMDESHNFHHDMLGMMDHVAHIRDERAGEGQGGSVDNQALDNLRAAQADFDKTNGVTKLAATRREFEAALASAKGKTGLERARAMEQFIRGSTGVGVRQGAQAYFQKFTGGTADQFENYIAQIRNGAPGKGVSENLIHAIEGAANEAATQHEAAHQSYNKTFHTPTYGPVAGNVNDKAVEWFGDQSDPNLQRIVIGKPTVRKRLEGAAAKPPKADITDKAADARTFQEWLVSPVGMAAPAEKRKAVQDTINRLQGPQ